MKKQNKPSIIPCREGSKKYIRRKKKQKKDLWAIELASCLRGLAASLYSSNRALRRSLGFGLSDTEELRGFGVKEGMNKKIATRRALKLLSSGQRFVFR